MCGEGSYDASTWIWRGMTPAPPPQRLHNKTQEHAASAAWDAITSQVGLAKYLTRLAGLRSLPAFSETGAGLLGTCLGVSARVCACLSGVLGRLERPWGRGE
jgi:hypothetical protein